MTKLGLFLSLTSSQLPEVPASLGLQGVTAGPAWEPSETPVLASAGVCFQGPHWATLQKQGLPARPLAPSLTLSGKAPPPGGLPPGRLSAHRVLGAGPCKPKFFSLDVRCEHSEALRRLLLIPTDCAPSRCAWRGCRRPSGRSALDQCGWAWGLELGAPLRPVGEASPWTLGSQLLCLLVSYP